MVDVIAQGRHVPSPIQPDANSTWQMKENPMRLTTHGVFFNANRSANHPPQAIRSSLDGSNNTAFDASNNSVVFVNGCGFDAGCTRLTMRLPLTCANTSGSGPV